MKDEIPMNVKMRLQKLLTLSQRGVGGEATAAREALERLCNNYGVSISELLDTEKKRNYRFEIGRGAQALTLFTRCFAQVVPDVSKYAYRRPTLSSIVLEGLTTAQYIDLKQLYEWHKENYKRELKEMTQSLRMAYIVKHRLYFQSERDETKETKEPTSEERAKLRRTCALMDWMGDETYHKLLE